jgi:hypothetical protein
MIHGFSTFCPIYAPAYSGCGVGFVTSSSGLDQTRHKRLGNVGGWQGEGLCVLGNRQIHDDTDTQAKPGF